VEELWIPIVAIVAPAAVVALAFWLRFRTRDGMQQTIRLALDKGVELSPELVDRLGHPKPSKDKDLRLALLWLAIAVGLALCGVAVPEPSGDALRGCLAGAAFPFAIGIAYLVIWRYAGRD
jgi:hypothetical protein